MTTSLDTTRTDIQNKISALVSDLNAGVISREQFDLAYHHYNSQLSLAEAFLAGETQGYPFNTRDLLRGVEAQAMGLSIYHHGSGTTVEVLGQFDLPSRIIAPILNDLSQYVEWQLAIDPIIKSLGKKMWAVFMARRYTTLIVLFRNEPSRRQIQQMVRLHHDFEETNRQLLMRFQAPAFQDASPDSLIKANMLASAS